MDMKVSQLQLCKSDVNVCRCKVEKKGRKKKQQKHGMAFWLSSNRIFFTELYPNPFRLRAIHPTLNFEVSTYLFQLIVWILRKDSLNWQYQTIAKSGIPARKW